MLGGKLFQTFTTRSLKRFPVCSYDSGYKDYLELRCDRDW